jgi:hypothetical protein
MKHNIVRVLAMSAILSSASVSYAQSGVTAFNSIPSLATPNVPSQGFECCATSEVGDEIKLAPGTPRLAGYATVLMSSWTLRSSYPAMPASGYTHPITLNVYSDAASAAAHTPLATVTQTFRIPWRPEADLTCSNGTAWRAADGKCYNGFAFTIQFDLRALSLTLPSQFIYGVAYDTQSWGYHPLRVPGPYESLNVGTANLNGVGYPPSVGTDVNPDVVYWNTGYGPFYADGGASGINTFRPDTGWTGYEIAAKFSTFAVPRDEDQCKKNGWRNLVRPDFSSFKNQGACVSYAERHENDRDDDHDREHGKRGNDRKDR